jgi:phosphatidylglycerol lysyltransferase
MTSVALRTVEDRLGGVWAPVRASLGRDRAPVFPWAAIGLAGAVVTTAVVTGAYTHEVPAHLGAWAGTGWPTLLAGRWWTLGTSFLLTRDWFMATTMPLCLLVGLAPYERRAGHARTFLVAFAGHVTGSVLLALAFAPLALTHVGMLVRAADNVDYGGSMAIAAGLGALVGFVGDRRITRLAVLLAVGGLLVHHQMADWGHVVALPLGYSIARVRSSRDVARLAAVLVGLTVLVAGVVAGFGS